MGKKKSLEFRDVIANQCTSFAQHCNLCDTPLCSLHHFILITDYVAGTMPGNGSSRENRIPKVTGTQRDGTWIRLPLSGAFSPCLMPVKWDTQVEYLLLCVTLGGSPFLGRYWLTRPVTPLLEGTCPSPFSRCSGSWFRILPWETTELWPGSWRPQLQAPVSGGGSEGPSCVLADRWAWRAAGNLQRLETPGKWLSPQLSFLPRKILQRAPIPPQILA